jgi:23S rRNA (adenine2503-C2)-methyltransferase
MEGVNMLEEQRHRLFTNGFVAVLNAGDNHPVETTATCLPLSTELRLLENEGKIDNRVEEYNKAHGYWKEKWMIGVSTLSGCPVMCKFCACNKVTEKNGWRQLTDIEIVNQVFYAEARVKGLYGSKIEGVDPRNAKLFRILFTRMGEPAYNIENVLRAIKLLKTEYPKARIQISTIGIPKSIELVDALIDLDKDYENDWLELQFSIHSTDDAFRTWLLAKNVLPNKLIGKLAEKFYFARDRKWKVTLNFALAQKTPFDPKALSQQFNKDACFVKLSPINENIVSKKNELDTLIHYKNTV